MIVRLIKVIFIGLFAPLIWLYEIAYYLITGKEK